MRVEIPPALVALAERRARAFADWSLVREARGSETNRGDVKRSADGGYSIKVEGALGQIGFALFRGIDPARALERYGTEASFSEPDFRLPEGWVEVKASANGSRMTVTVPVAQATAPDLYVFVHVPDRSGTVTVRGWQTARVVLESPAATWLHRPGVVVAASSLRTLDTYPLPGRVVAPRPAVPIRAGVDWFRCDRCRQPHELFALRTSSDEPLLCPGCAFQSSRRR